MTVGRIVANIAGMDMAAARAFYRDPFGLEVAMDLGWIVTFVSDAPAIPQVSIMAEGGRAPRCPTSPSRSTTCNWCTSAPFPPAMRSHVGG